MCTARVLRGLGQKFKIPGRTAQTLHFHLIEDHEDRSAAEEERRARMNGAAGGLLPVFCAGRGFLRIMLWLKAIRELKGFRI